MNTFGDLIIKKVNLFSQEEKWIADGNFGSVRDILWKRATDIIWLDYPLLIILKQFFKRSLIRSFKREELWHGNRETLWESIFKPNSLLVWVFKTYWLYKKKYSAIMASNEFLIEVHFN